MIIPKIMSSLIPVIFDSPIINEVYALGEGGEKNRDVAFSKLDKVRKTGKKGLIKRPRKTQGSRNTQILCIKAKGFTVKASTRQGSAGLPDLIQIIERRRVGHGKKSEGID